MNIVVFARLVPDLVEELTIADDGVSLDTAWLRKVISEFDNHALEQAILLKERSGGEVTVVAPEDEGADEMLFAAAAKGADRLVKLIGAFEAANSHALARAFADVAGEMRPDLVLTGVQAHTDLDGAVGPLLAEHLGAPYVGYVAGVAVEGATVTVRKEYPGGLVAETAVALPAVLGIQVAEQPPRYIAVSKIRQAMTSRRIEDRAAAPLDASGGAGVGRMYLPEAGQRATMLTGSDADIAARLVEVLRDLGAL